MTPRQIIDEIFRDYTYNLEAGMTSRQSVEVLKAMLLDALEAERERAFDMGVKSGRLGAMTDALFTKQQK